MLCQNIIVLVNLDSLGLFMKNMAEICNADVHCCFSRLLSENREGNWSQTKAKGMKS